MSRQEEKDMSKNSERFLRTKKLSFTEYDNAAIMKTKALKSHKRPVTEPAVAKRPVDEPENRALFPGDYTNDD